MFFFRILVRLLHYNGYPQKVAIHYYLRRRKNMIKQLFTKIILKQIQKKIVDLDGDIWW